MISCRYVGETIKTILPGLNGLNGRIFSFEGGNVEVTKYSDNTYEGYDFVLGDRIDVVTKHKKAIKREEERLEKLNEEKIQKLMNYPEEVREIILAAINYKGNIHVCNYKGMEFYEVGHNASHIFAVGFHEGSYYKLAIDCDCDLEEDKMYNLREVNKNNWGYVGHY